MQSEQDRRFPKYPMLPVLRCDGYRRDENPNEKAEK
jgi:hypothetical protein